jgi:hypothetical protein
VQQDEYERTRVIKWVHFIILWLVFVYRFVDMVKWVLLVPCQHYWTW